MAAAALGQALEGDEVGDLCDVLVAAAGEVGDDDLVGAHVGRSLNDLGDRVAGLERGDDPLELGQALERRQSLVVGGVGVLRAVDVAQPNIVDGWLPAMLTANW